MRIAWMILFSLAVAARGHGYVDYTPTLGRIVTDSARIALVEVEKVGGNGRAIVFRKVADIRGQWPAGPIRHQITDGQPPRPPVEILDWAVPGARAVMFLSGDSCLVCIGRHWYQAHPAADGWWRMTISRPDLPLAYCGSAGRLAEAVKGMVEGKTVVITTLAHGAGGVGACFDVALNRTDLAGSRGLQRIRAAMNMPWMVCYVSANPSYVVGPGAAGIEDIPRLMKEIESEDAGARMGAMDDLATLGASAKPAAPALEKLLDDQDGAIALHAAAALLQVLPGNAEAVARFKKALQDESAAVRKKGVDCIALCGPGGRPLVGELVESLKDSQTPVRLAAIHAIGAIGPDADAARDALVKLLDERELRCDAADALGRLGPAARAAGPALAKLMEQDDKAARWAAVRALVQIGGEDARAVVPFLTEECEKAPRGRDLYNISVYLGVLGPMAKPAIPTLKRALERDRELCAMALWAIEPEKKFPWDWGYPADRDIDRWLFEAYIREMGERAKPSAQALAKEIATGDPGRIPSWGYQILIDYPEVALPILEDALKGESPAARSAAIKALGQMGKAAAPARKMIEEARKGADLWTQLTIRTALKMIDGE
jgi:HEAT repeat protein